MKSVLTAHNLTKVYPRRRSEKEPFTAVDKASFDLKEGEILGVLGPNGAGKSTIISMLLGILTPSSGTVTVFDKDLHKNRSEVLQHMTFASTYVKMPWRLTVYENLRVFALFYQIHKKEFAVRAEKFLKYFGVWDQRNKTMNELSAGQVTRVMLAKAFIPYPKIVLLDEPTASLDPEIAHQVRKFVMEQQREFNTSILYTSHNMDEVTEVCDRVMFLQSGKIVAEDTPDKLAQSVSGSRMHLTVANDVDREKLLQLAREQGYSSHVEVRDVEIVIDETDVSGLLHQVAMAEIHYSHIEIKQPTLEDYFLEMAK